MALNIDQLAAELNTALLQADVDSAPSAVKQVKGLQTRQRIAMAKAIAEAVINHILKNAEVVVPPHDPFRTDIGGGPPHAHTVTVPVRHHNGKVI